MINQEECIIPIVILDLKTAMLKSSLCDYSDAYILVKDRITITVAGAKRQKDWQMREIKV